MSRTNLASPRNIALLAALVAVPAFAGNFLHTGAGPYDYNDTANWTGGTINNTWAGALTADQTITFNAANTTLSGTLSITNNSTYNHIFIGSGGDRTLTLGGSIASFGSTTAKVTFGSTTAGQRLNIDLGSTNRKIEPNANRTIEIINVVSGTAGINKEGAGTLILSNTANTFSGGISFLNAGGVLEVTKLANGGEDSSIGKSDNQSSRLSFGGSAAGTLRYVGAGDSTDRRFSIGSAGAIFDASGTGAIKWTNTASVSWAGTTNTARSLTLTGTSVHDNTMAAVLTNNGTGGATSITKSGAGRWILTGNNTNTGTTTVTAGTLATGATGTFGAGNVIVADGAFLTAGNAASFADTATLTFASTSAAASISLGSGTDVLGAVYDSVGATYLAAGTYDAAGLNNYFSTSVFTGLGSLTVTSVPEPSSYAALAGAGVMLLAFTRRNREH